MIEYNKEIKISEKLINGYQYFCDITHPLVMSGGYVLYHRHIASMKIGRWLESNECVHHIDGNKLNNDVENLLIVSRKEHGNIESKKIYGEKKRYYCSVCGKELKDDSMMCREHYNLSQRRFNPSKEELEKLIWEMPMTKIAKIYNVSDKSISKRCKLFGIKVPPLGYWLKK